MGTKYTILGNLLFLLLAILGLFLASCSRTVKKENEDESESVTPVTITHISFEAMTDYFELNANSIFQKKNIIRSTTTGIIQNIGINLGDNVSIGEVLFTVVTKEALALRGKTSISDTSFHFKGELKIKASQSGTVNSIAHQLGDFVQEGDELATIAEQNSLVFLLQAPYELANFAKQGTTCKIILPDNKTIDGVIGSILPAMDMQAQTVTLVVKPINSENIPENLIAKIRIAKSTKKRSATLPEDAVLTDETQTSFWVMKLMNDTIAIKVPIVKGIEANGMIEILQPEFLETDKILLTGNYGLEDTAKVKIAK
jgi:biotin carboxyl carrier protein